MVDIYFLDSSALVKRYVTEAGSNWLHALLAPETGNQIVVARITWVEVLSAFARLQRQGNLNAGDIAGVIQAFRYDWDTQYQVIEMDAALIEQAGQLVQKHPLRAYDSVQLSAALTLQNALRQIAPLPLIFLSADSRLLEAAGAEGLQTDNPNNHAD